LGERRFQFVQRFSRFGVVFRFAGAALRLLLVLVLRVLLVLVLPWSWLARPIPRLGLILRERVRRLITHYGAPF
jgi:hypothetical protein